jgi:hypothetical protein
MLEYGRADGMPYFHRPVAVRATREMSKIDILLLLAADTSLHYFAFIECRHVIPSFARYSSVSLFHVGRLLFGDGV